MKYQACSCIDIPQFPMYKFRYTDKARNRSNSQPLRNSALERNRYRCRRFRLDETRRIFHFHCRLIVCSEIRASRRNRLKCGVHHEKWKNNRITVHPCSHWQKWLAFLKHRPFWQGLFTTHWSWILRLKRSFNNSWECSVLWFNAMNEFAYNASILPNHNISGLALAMLRSVLPLCLESMQTIIAIDSRSNS